MNCKFKKKIFSRKKNGRTLYICIYCDLKVRSPNPAHRIFSNCSSVGSLPYARRVRNYIFAVVNMIRYRNKYGGWARSKGEINRIYKICAGNRNKNVPKCEFFNNDGCSRCGCRVSRSTNPFFNKIAMKSQKCPEGKW